MGVSSEGQIQKAIKALNLKMIRGRRLEVTKAVKKYVRNEDRNQKQFEDQEKTNFEAKNLKRCDPYDIYIGSIPVRFSESDLRNLFEEYGIDIFNIRFHPDRPW